MPWTIFITWTGQRCWLMVACLEGCWNSALTKYLIHFTTWVFWRMTCLLLSNEPVKLMFRLKIEDSHVIYPKLLNGAHGDSLNSDFSLEFGLIWKQPPSTSESYKSNQLSCKMLTVAFTSHYRPRVVHFQTESLWGFIQERCTLGQSAIQSCWQLHLLGADWQTISWIIHQTPPTTSVSYPALCRAHVTKCKWLHFSNNPANSPEHPQQHMRTFSAFERDFFCENKSCFFWLVPAPTWGTL